MLRALVASAHMIDVNTINVNVMEVATAHRIFATARLPSTCNLIFPVLSATCPTPL